MLAQLTHLDGAAPAIWIHDELAVRLVRLPEKRLRVRVRVGHDDARNQLAQLGGRATIARVHVTERVEETRVVRVDHATHHGAVNADATAA